MGLEPLAARALEPQPPRFDRRLKPGAVSFRRPVAPRPRISHPMGSRSATSTLAHRDHTRETTIQNARSMARSGGRGLARLRTASCCRSTRISTTRLARGRKASTSAPSRAETIANTAHPRWRASRVSSRVNRRRRSSKLDGAAMRSSPAQADLLEDFARRAHREPCRSLRRRCRMRRGRVRRP
jgi:hypothetical protein